MEPASAIVAKMVEALSAALPDRSGTPVLRVGQWPLRYSVRLPRRIGWLPLRAGEWCLLVNNLGAVPPLELSFVAGRVAAALTRAIRLTPVCATCEIERSCNVPHAAVKHNATVEPSTYDHLYTCIVALTAKGHQPKTAAAARRVRCAQALPSVRWKRAA